MATWSRDSLPEIRSHPSKDSNASSGRSGSKDSRHASNSDSALGAPYINPRGSSTVTGREFFHVARRLKARIPEGVRRSNFLNRGWHTPDPSGSDPLSPVDRPATTGGLWRQVTAPSDGGIDSSHGWVTPERQLSPRDVVKEAAPQAGLHDAVSAELSKVKKELLVKTDGAASSRNSVATASSSVHFDSPENTLIIVDWDDTLFPTTWIGRHYGAFRVWTHGHITGEAFLEQMETADVDALRELDSCARALIVAASQLGQVACVTLALRPWVDRCMKDFMPGLWEVWQDLGIATSYAREKSAATRVTSFTDVTPGPRRGLSHCLTGEGGREMLPAEARGQQEPDAKDAHTILVEGELCSQKRRSMQRVIRKFYKERSWRNVVSIGDGPAEREALKDLGLHHTNPLSPKRGSSDPFRVKTVKMIEGPDCTSLTAEHQIIQAWLPPMVSYADDFDIQLDGDEETIAELQQQLYDSDASICSKVSTTRGSDLRNLTS